MPDAVSLNKICVTVNCGKPASWKGLCTDCHRDAKKAVEAGTVTWEQLYQEERAVRTTSAFAKAPPPKEQP